MFNIKFLSSCLEAINFSYFRSSIAVLDAAMSITLNESANSNRKVPNINKFEDKNNCSSRFPKSMSNTSLSKGYICGCVEVDVSDDDEILNVKCPVRF